MNLQNFEQLLAPLNKTSRRRLAVLCLLIVAILGGFDHAIGPELSSSIFYVLPISLAAWYGSRWLGLGISLLCALVWMLTDVSAGREVSSVWVLLWNMLARLGLFVIISELIAGFRRQFNHSISAANTDPLTGVLNYRGFFQLAGLELQRGKRYQHPLSVIFFDLDNFKWVNDQMGHAQGDELLKFICQLVTGNIRQTDLFGRLGGDEFAIMLTETGPGDADNLAEKLRQLLADEMRQRQWPVSFSMGLISFNQCPDNMNDVIKLADDLMYAAKRGGKNNVVKLHFSPEHAG